MGSRAQGLIGAALLAAGSAGAVAALESPRLLVLAAGVAVLGFGLVAVALRARPAPVVVRAFATGDAEALAHRLAVQDALLEQLPVALWTQPGGQALAPLNARARRMLAPGGVVGLQERLSEDPGPLLHIATERGDERWLLSRSQITLAGQETRLVAMLPVESELEAENMRAWRQLVHVLTHEIMNSLTPIASLTRTAQDMLAEPPGAEREQDLGLALETVGRRAASLAAFVGNYRRLSELPAPRPEPVLLAELFARLDQLVGAAWRERGGGVRLSVEPATLTLMADPGQLEQALLNLVKNAAEATAGMPAPQLSLSARLQRGGRLAIEVRDNGPGVPAGLEQDIFLPFFSAREGGQGIGLSLVRSLVHGMGGTVRHVKPVKGGAAFVLGF